MLVLKFEQEKMDLLEGQKRRELALQISQRRIDGIQAEVAAAAREAVAEAEACAICADRPRSVVVLPCSHASFCDQCVATYLSNGGDTCPICRTRIGRAITYFRRFMNILGTNRISRALFWIFCRVGRN